MPFASSQVLYHHDGTFGETSVQWSLAAKAVLTFPDKMPDGRHNSEPQILEEQISLFVERGEARPQFVLSYSNEEGSPGYFLLAIFCLLILLPFGWGVNLLAIACLLYGLFFIERLMTRNHLLRGLDVQLEANDEKGLLVRFDSIAGADDFTEGGVSVTLKERYLETYKKIDGLQKSKLVERVLFKRFKRLKNASRQGREVVCSLPLTLNNYPATLNFDEDHGYAWTVSYVYRRKYWMDVRVNWDVQASLVTQNPDS